MSKFNKEKDELLIESIKSFNALYDKSDRNHKNNIYKHQCWEKISDAVGSPVLECKKRFKSLRDQYNKNIKDGCGTGSARTNNNWEYMELLSFLSDAPEKRDSITNIHLEKNPENDLQTSNTDVNTGTDDDTELNAGTDADTEVNTSTAELNITENEQTMQNNTDDSSHVSPAPKRRKMSKLQQTLDKREGERLKLLETLVNSATTNNQSQASQVKPPSTIKKFFESMAEVVETFPPREQASIRMKVCQLVSDTEIKINSAMTPMPEDSWNSDYFNL